MIRDPGPIQSLGSGVTSRDVPLNEGETQGVSPNSGYVSRALNQHPVMRFFATTAATLTAVAVANTLTKKGGLKLAKFAQSRADTGNPFATRFVNSATAIRRELDELQGVYRRMGDGGEDPYTRLVYEIDGKLGTGYKGTTNERFGYGYYAEGEKRASRITGEDGSIVQWSTRDQIQQRLIRAGRRMPYELPAMYAAQKTVIDPLMGESERNSNVKWYNPLDVVSDFTKQSMINMATMVLPFEMAGAAAGTAKSSLHTLRWSQADLRQLTGKQYKMHKGFVDLTELLSEVGHDISTVGNKLIKKSAQTSAALSEATRAYQRTEQGFVPTLYRLRHGAEQAYRQEMSQTGNKMSAAKKAFTSFFDSSNSTTAFDLSPGLRGMHDSFRAARAEFKRTGQAYDALSNSISYNKVLGSVKSGGNLHGLFGTGTDDQVKASLHEKMLDIRSGHNSKFARFAKDLHNFGVGNVAKNGVPIGEFTNNQRTDAFRGLIEQNLISNGVSAQQAKLFRSQIGITLPKTAADSTDEIVKLGNLRIYGEGANPNEQILDYYGKVIKRFQGIKGGEDFAMSADALQQSVDRAKSQFLSKEFQKTLNDNIKKNWSRVEKDLPKIASDYLKPQKASYRDFTGVHQLTGAKQEFLQRKTAETLGISLRHENGRVVSNSIITQKLRQEGFDPNNFGELRSFLVRNRKMDTGILGAGVNIFGLKSVTVDEARKANVFSGLEEGQRKVIDIIAGQAAINDPLSSSIGLSNVRGLYKSSHGKMIDMTSLTGMAGKLGNFLGQEFQIPILGFNPTDLFAGRSFNQMRSMPAIQYVSASEAQPFIKSIEGSNPEFYIWNRVRGTKGRLTQYSNNPGGGSLLSNQFDGYYRALPTSSMDLLTREARNASGLNGNRVDEISGGTNSRFLNKIFRGDQERILNFKKRFNIDPEQPNSLFGWLRRFNERKTSLNNPANMAKALRDGEIVPGNMSSQQLRALDQLADMTFGNGMPLEVMKAAEAAAPQYFRIGGQAVSEITSESGMISLANQIIKSNQAVIDQYRKAQLSPDVPLKNISRIKEILRKGNLSQVAESFENSPTINTRLDQLRNEIFRYATEVNPAINGGNKFSGIVEIQGLVDDLVRTGKISSAQRAEAQAAALSTLFNTSAFSTYKSGLTNTQNAIAAAEELMKGLDDNAGLKNLFDPFTEGTLASVGSTGRSRASKLFSFGRRKFGKEPYQINEYSVNPLGSGNNVTIVPTFSASYGRSGKDALKSVLGVNTYRNPEGYSGSSVPMQHAVGRLNRYFGTVGLGLDPTDFNGPLDLFARGMVGKRVLPLTAAGTTFMALDRTAGGYINNEKDNNGERIYSPLVMGTVARGAVEARAMISGITPGGSNYQEMKEQLLEGEVAIKQGRFWPLGNTPFSGGKTMYYRPSFYRRMMGSAQYTSDTYGTPIERSLFYYDYSPLRPFDPYRFERKHYEDRPYPVTGEYFSGPFGPLTPLLNATVGKILKPQLMMHEEEVAEGLANYVNVGTSGAYDATAYIQGAGGGGGGQGPTSSIVGGLQGSPSAMRGGSGVASYNSTMLANAGKARNTASGLTVGSIAENNMSYVAASNYGPPKVSGIMTPNIVGAGEPVDAASAQYQLGEIGYRVQEMAGIYGFGFASLRESFGFGQSDFEQQKPVLQSAAKAYGSSRAFWDLNLGGLGDVPLPSRDALGNFEFSEIVRRFIPKDRKNIDYVNPIRNTMGREYPFLPGAEYFTDFQTGDPFTKVQEGELRLPGKGYERFNTLYGDGYGPVNQLDILADVAPYSKQFKTLNRQIDKMDLSPAERIKVNEVREQVADTTSKYNFSEYQYKNSSPEEAGMHRTIFGISRIGEMIAHTDNFVVNKVAGKRTAVEDWERRNVYGSTFPEWSRPYESYIQPMLDKSTQRNPIVAAGALATIGSFFGRTPRAKFVGSAIGAVAGGASSLVGNASEMITGDRYIPKRRKEELALEEYIDILSYVKNTRLASQAQSAGDSRAAVQYRMAAKRTMYGADIYSEDIDTLALAIPKRKREHFRSMIQEQDQGERERILSTAGRLERRIYQAAWGMQVERRPDLNDYFERHEMPDENWEGWHPNTNMDHVKIKMGQSMGIEMSQMGYYPQQIKQANLSNPSYPDFFGKPQESMISRIRGMISDMGLSGSVQPIFNPFGGEEVNVYAGVS